MEDTAEIAGWIENAGWPGPIPLIGPALAGRIIAYRQERGPFARVADVVNVRGIGPKTLERVEPWLYVE